MKLACIFCDEFPASAPDGTCDHCESLPGAPLDERGDEPEGEPAVHVLYRITHRPSGEWYTGVHRLPEGWARPFDDDGYTGSGDRLARKLDAHPWEEFEKKVLVVLPNEASAYELEAGLVTEASIKNPKCLNLRPGGVGGAMSEESLAKRSASPWRENLAASNRTPEIRAQRRKSSREMWARASDEERAARIEAAAEGGRAPEARARQRAGVRAYWAAMTPEERSAERLRRNAVMDPQAKRRHAEATAQANRRPERRAKVGERSKRAWASLTDEQRSARVASAVEGRRRAKAERERVRREVAVIFSALLVQRYGQA